ncbi:MAG: DUF4089 domain-containing protein [Caulobacter sp.]|nr:DUF4089 domain-containing protein [Caulobacter sp.]
MAADPALEAFLALEDDAAVATYADARARELALAIPAECRPGVIENLALLRRQAASFASLAPAGPVEAFEP